MNYKESYLDTWIKSANETLLDPKVKQSLDNLFRGRFSIPTYEFISSLDTSL